jgi:hypothetical protein
MRGKPAVPSRIGPRGGYLSDGSATPMRGKSATCRHSPLLSFWVSDPFLCGHRPPQIRESLSASHRLAANRRARGIASVASLNERSTDGLERTCRASIRTASVEVLSTLGQFIRNFIRVENLTQHLEHATRVDGNGAVHGFIVDVIAHQRLDVAVKDQSDQLAVLIDCG